MRALLLLCVASFGCSHRAGGGVYQGPTDLAPTNARIAARPYRFQIPSTYDPARPTPLVILLHGYSINGVLQDLYFGFSAFAELHTLLYVYPDGTLDRGGNRFWDATDACCGDVGTVDDVGWLAAVIDDMSAKWNVDPKRIFVTGHSNGGFMAHRLACDLAPRVAAIVSLAGVNWRDQSRCRPTEPVAVLQVHGDADTDVQYDGGTSGGTGALYPSALESIRGWAMRDGCRATADGSAPPLDLDVSIPGAETSVLRWTGCRPGGAAELWTIRGAGHLPALRPSWSETIYGFMAGHPKP